MATERLLVVAARRFSFQDPAGKGVEGAKLTCVQGPSIQETDSCGVAVLSLNVPLSFWSDLRAIPGVYDLEMSMRPDSKGKPVQKCVAVCFIREADVLAPLQDAPAGKHA